MFNAHSKQSRSDYSKTLSARQQVSFDLRTITYSHDRLTKAETIRMSSQPNFRILIFAITLKVTVRMAIPVSAQMSLRSLGPRSKRAARGERAISVGQ